MAIQMARPTKRKGTAKAQFKRRVPLHLIDRLKGEAFTADLPLDVIPLSGSIRVQCIIHEHVKFSLRTADPKLVRVRHAAASQALDAFFASAERGPSDLTHRQLMDVCWMAYETLLDAYKDQPPATHREDGREVWSEFEVINDIITDAERLLAYGSADRRREADGLMRRLVDVDAMLSAKAIRLSEKSRNDLTEALPATYRKAVTVLAARAAGDYSPDPIARSFPSWALQGSNSNSDTSITRQAQSTDASECQSFETLFEVWRKANNPKPSTISTWKGRVQQFSEFTGKTDPRQCTEADAQRWRDHLLERGRKNINNGHLMTLRRLYGYALENSATTGITHNPFAKVKANQKKVAGDGRLPFTKADAALILSAARKESKPHLRWVPWLQAQTGARIAELVQLWATMVREIDGIPCIHITPAPDGGSLKNAQSERIVPIHPDLIADGFLDFVKSRGKGPLFYREVSHKAARARKDGASRHKSKGVANRVGAWVNSLGMDLNRKAPTHSWRHWFKTEMLRLKVDKSIRNAIQGHDDREVSEIYTHVDTPMMLEAISKLNLMALASD